ncbi:MAG: glycine C-acetyltransferase [Bacilli bacterium]|jgi:glycine C-acetyltransferase
MATVKEKLQALKDAGTYRVLPVNSGPCDAMIILNGRPVINLSSNNYLGFANHPRLKKAAIEAIQKYGVGAGAVRTIVGNMDIHERLDETIAKFKHEEASVVFQSGFACNSGVIQAVTGEKDLIISDELNHASIIDGVRLSKASRAVFKHADMADLERILIEKRDQYEEVLIITDGVFSMDGDIANLPEIVRLAKKYQAQTYVDDAHGSGVLGTAGRGTVDHFGLHGQVDYIIGTLSKAIGVVGGYVCCSKEAREYLLHLGRPLLFSTSLMPGAAAAIIEAFKMLEESNEYTVKLWDNARHFKKKLLEAGFDIGRSQTPITPIIVGDEAKTLQFSRELLKRGVFVSGIVFPTVPKGTGRIRCMVNALHTKTMLDDAVAILKDTAQALHII